MVECLFWELRNRPTRIPAIAGSRTNSEVRADPKGSRPAYDAPDGVDITRARVHIEVRWLQNMTLLIEQAPWHSGAMAHVKTGHLAGSTGGEVARPKRDCRATANTRGRDDD